MVKYHVLIVRDDELESWAKYLESLLWYRSGKVAGYRCLSKPQPPRHCKFADIFNRIVLG